jgi:hypothetical protein
MRRRLAAAILVVAAAFLLLDADGHAARQRGKQDVYFGFLLGTPRIAAVAIDLAPPDHAGQRRLRAYVCDGLGIGQGIAIWFTGSVAVERGPDPLSFTSVTGNETLVLHAITDRGVYGAFTGAGGARAHFISYAAIDGAGIYQVTVDHDLRYTGTSTDGARLVARQAPDGTTVGTIKPAGGRAIRFSVHNLALASFEALAAHGFPADFKNYATVSQVPGDYVAVIAPGGTHWFGRIGNVTGGNPGPAIIGLDKKDVD